MIIYSIRSQGSYGIITVVGRFAASIKVKMLSLYEIYDEAELSAVVMCLFS